MTDLKKKHTREVRNFSNFPQYYLYQLVPVKDSTILIILPLFFFDGLQLDLRGKEEKCESSLKSTFLQ